MSLTLPSARAEFDGFADYYEAHIAPYLKEKESARKKAVGDFFLILGAAIIFVILVLALAPFGEAKFHIAFVGAMLAAAGGLARLNVTRKKIALGLFDKICAKLGCSYRKDMGRPHYAEAFDRFGLFLNYNRETWEDEVRGERHGAGFTMCEAHLRYKTSGKKSSTRTVFHGQLLVLEYPMEFLGVTVIMRDAGLFNRFIKPGKEFQQVGLASPEFEKAFEAWSTDQVEARMLLDPIVLERFQELDRLYDGAKFRGAFTQGKFYAALETGDKLNMGSMFKPLHGAERVEKILKEFDLIFDLIDVLSKRLEGRLDGAFKLDAVKSR